MVPPPLIGDAQGRYRIHLVGNSGTGKTTVGKELARMLNVPFISLYTLYFTPGWGHISTSEFRAKLKAALEDAPNGWVVDGNYGNRLGNILQSRSTDMIWLDPPLLLYFPRIFVRTVLGLLGLRPPCSPGCPERFVQAFFSRESILWWCLTHHFHVRRREGARMQLMGIGDTTQVSGRKMRRIGGWGGEVREWLEEVRIMLQQR
ncbi:hypothetical protein B0H14DRAFT_1032302 [Mycena olivaceomarginata]|nr:hypothetical protein B0H14DRAFT_1032302 [Mycena olivaceomarginata]